MGLGISIPVSPPLDEAQPGECTVLDQDLEKGHNVHADVSISWVHGVF